MALSRRTGQKFQASIWPGFVDAMTALLLVLMFVLTIFMIVQFMLRETITGQDIELDQLSEQVQSLADALGLEQNRANGLQDDVGRLDATLDAARNEAELQAALILSLQSQTAQQTEDLASAQSQISSFEAQVAGLLTERDAARSEGEALTAELADLTAAQTALMDEQSALQLALAQARSEIDEGAEAARLAAARRNALEVLIADLRHRGSEAQDNNASLTTRIDDMTALIASLQDKAAIASADNIDLETRLNTLQDRLTEEEAAKFAESLAAEALRQRLQDADAELTAMTLALEEQRRQAEETLTLLAAADAAKDDVGSQLALALLSLEQAEIEKTGLEEDVAAALLTQTLSEDGIEAAQAELDEVSSEKLELESRLALEIAARAVAESALAEAVAAAGNLDVVSSENSELQAQLALVMAARDAAESELVEAQAEVSALEQVAAENTDLEGLLARALAAKLAAEELAASTSSSVDERNQALADALAARLAAQNSEAEALDEAERQAILLAQANRTLEEQEAQSAESQRRMAVLNQQVAELRNQLGALQALLDEATAQDVASNVRLESLGSQLNTALARVAAEERRRRELEEAERIRLEAQALDLARYRSEFFGKLRDVLGETEGVRIVGDRFVFSSEVLFQSASVDLSPEGRGEIDKIAQILRGVADDIPDEIDWVIRVDGHTDNVPLGGSGRYRDNWELSQGRALSVVRYMIDNLGIPADRLIAAGFGEHHPLNPESSREARAQNRRIELKLTEK